MLMRRRRFLEGCGQGLAGSARGGGRILGRRRGRCGGPRGRSPPTS